MPNPSRNKGFRPQLSAVCPTKSASGSITSGAMQADIIASPLVDGRQRALPDKREQRRIGEMKQHDDRPKITSGRVLNKTP